MEKLRVIAVLQSTHTVCSCGSKVIPNTGF